MDKKESTIGVEVQKRPDLPYDILQVSLPFPRMEPILPKETSDHLNAARKEGLLAIHSLLDRWIASLEKPAEKQPRRSKATRIDVEGESTDTAGA